MKPALSSKQIECRMDQIARQVEAASLPTSEAVKYVIETIIALGLIAMVLFGYVLF